VRRSVFVAFLLAVIIGCTQRMERVVTAPTAAGTLDKKSPYIKVHMRDGALYVLSPWTWSESARTVNGTGTLFGVDRSAAKQGDFSVPIDSVALLETNVVKSSPSVVALSIMSGITASIAIYCASNPKACFGSCPTFYITDGTRDVLQAEGFSASIAPSLEARDVDALYRAQPRGRDVHVRMMNEAYETHVVRYVNLLAAPRVPGRRVLVDERNRYWSVTEPAPPDRCAAGEGDCRSVLAAFDEKERTSAADSSDLASREFIDIEFASGARSPGLVLASRQSLLPTYLLYQTFAYLGSHVGDWMSMLERGDSSQINRAKSAGSWLGGIDVLVPNASGGWDSVTTVRETGPLASDVRVIPLPQQSGTTRVRLRLAKGAWRIDAAQLVSIGDQVTPLRIEPSDVFAGAKRDTAARGKLSTGPEALVTLPGDEYNITYHLPGDASQYELFLDSKGYYLEWMRSEWVAEENLFGAQALFLDPAGAMKQLAPAFKRVEPTLEEAFWRSKYVKR